MKSQLAPFWVIMSVNKNGDYAQINNIRYDDFEAAENDARILARESGGDVIHVMGSEVAYEIMVVAKEF